MICELFPFQKQAVNEMRLRVAMALNNYRMLKIPQVVSLQAPTGSGKTIIMSALIEDIFYGSEQFTEQPEAIFVWLSDSPQLNEQSKQKIELKADKVRMDQCVVISDESFDREILEDGHIYFLNTQKLGKAGNLSRHSDTRQYTIWETIENTAREKADRLYFIIDEAHRGMQGRQAGTATTIMQRFIKGSSEQNLSPIPVVIGMSATAERFNSLVGQATNSTLHKVVISPAQVRQSGLLKDRIVITYPEDPIKHGDMAVLQAATDEWQDKCKHWYQYTYEQHYTNVNPVFVIQVCAGSGTKVSDTDLDDVIAKIEERMGDSFKENEVVHTFGSTGTLSIHGLTVPHIEPSEIAEDRRIRVVLFKENLSTGWDCPRAETMMSFRRAEDATYIAQLLGRMVRTPLRRYVGVCAPGQSVKTALLRVYSIILQSAYNLSLDDEYKDVIDPYYTLVGYYNSIRELGGAVRLLQDDIPDRIQRIKKKYGMSRQRFLNHKVEITSRMSSYDIPKKLSQLETPYTDRNCLDTAIATNMIAVGMDVDRLGLMVVTGQPKQNSEYIQATSRIGRSYPGLVVTLYNPYRPRDLSHYENFTGYHAQLYRFVEGTTATPFSARARDRVLHALVISAIRLHYPEFASNDGAAAIDKLTDEQLNEVKALIMNRLNIIKPSAKADAEHEIDDFISNWKLLATQSKELRYYVYTTKTYNRLMNTYGEVCTDLEKPTLRSMRDVERAANMFYYTED